MTKQSLRITVATPLIIVCSVLISGRTAVAQNCSNRMLRGTYGFSVEGVALPPAALPAPVPPPGVAIPLRGVALTTFDGDGRLTQVDHIIFAGFPPALDWTFGSGAYHVNPDCTGTAHIDVPSTGEFINLRFVVVNQGREIHTVVTAPFDMGGLPRTVTSVGIKTE